MNPTIIGLLSATSIGAIILAASTPRTDLARRVAALGVAGAIRDGTESGLVRRLSDDRSRAVLRQHFSEAGWYKTSIATYYANMLLCVLAGIGLGLLVLTFMGRIDNLTVMAVVLLALCGLLIPNVMLKRAIQHRKLAIGRALPDWLDVVSTSVEAGIALNGALAMSLDAISGPLAEELREVLSDVRMGRSRAEALSAMADRVKQIDLTATVAAMVQTEKLGGNIGNVLDELAAEARDRRLMRAEELGAQLPVKMVIPMALFMLPALFVMIFGPVVADLTARLK
jgi:pilus assembly protein TadC